jgi:AcrR family transcriptional regulator
VPQDDRKSRNPERTRAAIFDAARDVFVERGYAGASIRSIAERAGITHGTIYLYFRDKDDLLYQLSEEHFRQLLARLRELPRTLDPLARLREAFLALVAFGLDYPSHYHLMIAFRPPHLVRADAHALGPLAQETFGYFHDALGQAVKRSLMTTDDIHLDALAILATAHGIIEFTRVGITSREQVQETAHRAIGRIITGLRSSQ